MNQPIIGKMKHEAPPTSTYFCIVNNIRRTSIRQQPAAHSIASDAYRIIRVVLLEA